MKTRRQFSPEFKAKAAVEPIKGQRTLNEIVSGLEIHPCATTVTVATPVFARLFDRFSQPRL